MSPDNIASALKKLEDVPALLKRLEDHDARYSAIETGMLELSATLAEAIEVQNKQLELLTKLVAQGAEKESPGDEAAEYAPIVEAIKSIRFPEPKAAANAQDWKRLHVSIPQGEDRPPRTMTITKA